MLPRHGQCFAKASPKASPFAWLTPPGEECCVVDCAGFKCCVVNPAGCRDAWSTPPGEEFCVVYPAGWAVMRF